MEVAPGEQFVAGAVTVTASHAEHDGSRGPTGPRAAAVGYILADATRRIYHTGDTDLFAGMEAIGATGLDLVLVPIWGWGRTLGAGHLDPERAASALALLQPRQAVPIHWGTFAPGLPGGQAPAWLSEPLPAFLAAAARQAPDVVIVTLASGGRLVLD